MTPAAIIGIVLSALVVYMIVAGATHVLLGRGFADGDSFARGWCAAGWPLFGLCWLTYRAFVASFSLGERAAGHLKSRRTTLPKATARGK